MRPGVHSVPSHNIFYSYLFFAAVCDGSRENAVFYRTNLAEVEGMGLWLVDPEQGPLLKASGQLQENRFSSNYLIALANVFNGENTLSDIADKKKQCVTMATRALVNFMKQG